MCVTDENVQNIEDQIDNAGGINFAGLNLNANDEHRVRFAGYITGNLTGDVRVGQVRRLQVDGAIQGEVFGGFAYAPDGFSVGTIQAWSIASTASVSAGNGASLVRVFGNIEGVVDVLSGSINDLVVNGNVSGLVDVAQNIRRVTVNNGVTGTILARGTTVAPSTESATFGAVDGLVQLGPVSAATPSATVISTLGGSSGQLRAYSVVGSLVLDSFSGTATAGVYIEQDFRGNIVALEEATINLIQVGGDILEFVPTASPAGPNTRIQASSIGSLIVEGNLGVGCVGFGRLLLVDTMGRLEVGGSLEACISNTSNTGPSQISEIFVGGDLSTPLQPPRFEEIWLTQLQEMTVHGSVDRSQCKTPRPQVHLRDFPSGSRIDIGGRFVGDLYVGFGASDTTPFSGEMTVNSRLCSATAEEAWPSESFFWVYGSEIQELPMPFYRRRVPSLGGGYLAVLPYGLYESMCKPVDNSSGSDRITASSFYRGQNDTCTNNDAIALHFYGPIEIWNDFVPAAKVELLTPTGTIDVSRFVTYRTNPTNPRELLIEGKLDNALPPGNYRVTNSTFQNQALFCKPIASAGTPCITGAAVSPFEYRFELLPDCAAPFCEPESNPSVECIALPSVLCDSIDFNNDGGLFDLTDIDAFLSVFAEGPCIPATATCNDIDFNNDGGFFDPCDSAAFMLMFSEGPCTACGQ